MSLALGGCLKAPPIALGLTADTGGHLTYVWGAAAALAEHDEVTSVEVVTRLIDDPQLGADYAQPCDTINAKLSITRVATDNSAYLSKEAAAADRPAFIRSLIDMLAGRDELPDIVHAHFADAADVAIALRDRFGIPFIFTAHSLAIDKAACGLVTPDLEARIALEDRAIAEADAVIASSRDEAERQLACYPSADPARIYRVPPGAVLSRQARADTGRASALLSPFLRDPDKPILLAIARPVHKKNLAGLVDMYAADPVLRKSANLVIVAGLRDGPDSGETEQREVMRGLLDRMDRYNLYGSFALPKQHDQDDIAALYALTRQTGGIFVNPALTEPYGLTLTEAAHHGVPVVATCNGGAADIVTALEHGSVADPTDKAAFAAEIRRLLSDMDRWLLASHNGRMRARNLSWDRYADHFCKIVRGITKPLMPVVQPHSLLLCDIDHTLTGCRIGAGELTEAIMAEPKRAFGIATGRSLPEARRILAEWNYPDPAVWITSVGSEIYWQSGERQVADTGYAEYLADGWDADAIVAALASLSQLTPQPPVEQRRFKRSWFASDRSVATLVRARLLQAGLSAKVIYSHGDLLDVLPERSGKSGAMRWVAERLGLPLSAIVAAGDSGNDFDMLEACPNAILVANHSAELAALIGRPGVHVARRKHAGGIVDALNGIGRAELVRVAA